MLFWVLKIIRNEEPSVPVNSKSWSTCGLHEEPMVFWPIIWILFLFFWENLGFKYIPNSGLWLFRTENINPKNHKDNLRVSNPPPGFLISATHVKITRGGHGSCGVWSGAGPRKRTDPVKSDGGFVGLAHTRRWRMPVLRRPILLQLLRFALLLEIKLMGPLAAFLSHQAFCFYLLLLLHRERIART